MKELIKNVGKTLQKNSPAILTGLSIAGLASTTIFAIKAAPKALELIEEDRNDTHDEWCIQDIVMEAKNMSKVDVIKIVYKPFLPVIGMATLSIGCIIGAHSINSKRAAALAGMYTIAESSLKEYQAKVVETIGTKKEQGIRDEIAKDTLANNPVESNDIIHTGKGDLLCLDKPTGRYFRTSMKELRKAESTINKMLLDQQGAVLNDLYYELDLPESLIGNMAGWNHHPNCCEYSLELKFSSAITQSEELCMVIDYDFGLF